MSKIPSPNFVSVYIFKDIYIIILYIIYILIINMYILYQSFL